MLNDKMTQTPSKLAISYRVLLATVGGFFFTLALTVFVPELLLWIFGWNKATTLMWMMLLSFGVYCGLIMWIIATRKLLKASFVILFCGVCLAIGFSLLQSHNTEQLALMEVLS